MARRNDLGTTWWAKAWLAALETRALRDPNRLPRGRTYARQGKVLGLDVAEAEIGAAVQGSRGAPYRTRISVRRFLPEERDVVLSVIGSRAGFEADLLAGVVPEALLSEASAAGVELLPDAGDLELLCSCPDWAVPCKHLAAVCYQTAVALDDDPFQLFLLRGWPRQELDESLRTARAEAARGATVAIEAPTEPAAEAWARPPVAASMFASIARDRDIDDSRRANVDERWGPATSPPDGLPSRLRQQMLDARQRAAATVLEGRPLWTELDADADRARRDAVGERDAPDKRRRALAASWSASEAAGVKVARLLSDTGEGKWPSIDIDERDLAVRVLLGAGLRVRRGERWLSLIGRAQRLVFLDRSWWLIEGKPGAWVVLGCASTADLDTLLT